MYSIKVKDHFDSAHLIRGHEGKCRNLHGHRWEVEVSFSCSLLNKMGMAEDFSVLKKILKKNLQHYDHKNLIEVEPYNTINPTAENIAFELFHAIKKETPSPLCIEYVSVWESPECCVSYKE